MASLEKLVKAFEALKVFQLGSNPEEASRKKDPLPSKKEKIVNCNVIADCICSSNLRNVADYPKFLGIAMETFLMLCDDVESDVRIVSDECLNRTIKVLMDSSLGRLQVELYKEIKKNGAARSLRAALWRFADLAHLIRPQKCRPYVVNLLPCLARISKRPEESIQETLIVAIHKMAPVLMGFTNDAETKMLLKAFLPNIKSTSSTMRRTASSSLALVCQYSRKPHLFSHWLLQALIEQVVPVDIGDNDSPTLLGVLLALRHLLPLLATCLVQPGGEQPAVMRESFGQKSSEPQGGQVTVEQLVQVYEVLLYFVDHKDHNVVTASLETLQQLLKCAPSPLLHVLVTRGSIKHTAVYTRDLDHLQRVTSQARLPSVCDEAGIEDDIEPYSEVKEKSGESTQVDNDRDHPETANGGTNEDAPDGAESSLDGANNVLSSMTTEGGYSNIEIGDLAEDKANMSESSSMETLSETNPLSSPLKDPSLIQVSSASAMDNGGELTTAGNAGEIDVTEVIQPSNVGSTPAGGVREGCIGVYADENGIPLVYCSRVLCSKLLLTGYKHGLIPDRQVRVSVKALALNCLGCIATLYPSVLLQTLHISSAVPGDFQCMKDVLLYTSHSDPQLKGNTAVLVGNLIKAALHESRGHFNRWMRNNEHEGLLSLEELNSLLISILEDESSVASRLGLVAFKAALPAVLQSSQSPLALLTLLALLRVKENPYWLVKVELLELLSEVDYRVICYLEAVSVETRKDQHQFVGSLALQERVLRDVVLCLLGDEDARVRSASAAALTKMITGLFYPVDNALHDPVIRLAKDLSAGHFDPILHECSTWPQPIMHGMVKPFDSIGGISQSLSSVIESVLSRVVAMLVEEVTRSTSKYLTYGCCRALCKLSEEFSVPLYAAAWCCCPLNAITMTTNGGSTSSPAHTRSYGRSWSGGSTGRFVDSITSVTSNTSALSLEELASHSAGGPLPILLSILTASQVSFDFSTHQDTLRLAGNVFAGAAYKCLRNPDEVSSNEQGHWAALGDRLLVPLADQLLTHLTRLLNICAHVIEETSPGPPQTKPSLPSLPNAPSLSPIKRKTKGKDDSANTTGGASASPGGGATASPAGDKSKTPGKESGKESEKDKNKKEGLGTFYNLPQYVKLYESLRGAYSTYKISLELSGSEKFISILRTSLEVLSQVLEIACLPEVAKHAEEFLGYLKSTFLMEPTSTVLCVQQLLKSIFGTNLASQWESNQSSLSSRKPGKATRLPSAVKPGLYHSCFTKPYTQFTQCLASATFRASSHSDHDESFSLINWLRKKAEKKVPAILKPGSKTDKNAVASYIRLFEPLVIKALKQYTVTSCLELQRQVLHLLAQLVDLRVNYCLLDSDQIFIGFVIKQFEFIEEGQIRNCELLLPSIFHFLVLLSYERYHSKTIIAMPKVIQLCDGIMASGLNPELHVIPALQCIVQDLFVLRGTSSNRADTGKDLETQREVVVSMLLRLLNYHQVCELVIVVLHQCRKEGEDRWKRLSRQVTDLILPMLAKQQVNLGSQQALDVVHRLFECVATSVFRPVDILLKTLFAPPQDLSTVESLERWLCLVLIVLRVVMAQSKEEVVLSRLHELGLGVTVLAPSRDCGGDEATSTPGKHGIVGASAEETLARFMLQVAGVAAMELSCRLSSLAHSRLSTSCSFLAQELSHLLLYITHMFQSGIYRRVAMTAMSLVRQETPAHFLSVQQINSAFSELIARQPTLTLQWCNVLILLNFEDQSWWGGILQTPKKYMVPSPNRGSFDSSASSLNGELCISKEIVRRGGLILFCDYVCENLNDAEHMTWVVINHVNDLIHLSQEPPVQDFISAIHRNSAASGLFIQAINSRCENLSKAVLAQKTLRCLEAIHLSQSGALLTLLIDKFLHTHHLAVSRFCHTIACRRVEMLLAEDVEVSSSQLPLEDLEKLLQFMKSTGLTQRHTRLASLLNKLRQCMCPESCLTLSPEKTHPLAISMSSLAEIKINKDWYLSIVRDQCYTKRNSQRECAQLLQYLDYPSILNVIMAKDCSLTILEECVSLGAHLSLVAAAQSKNDPGHDSNASPTHQHNLHPLFRAAQITLFRHINSFINMLPVPHQIINYCAKLSAKEEQYREKMDDSFSDSRWMDAVFHLTAGLLRYLVALQLFPWQPAVPDESVKDISRFSILCLEALHWMLNQGQFPNTRQLVIAVELFAVAMRTPQLQSVIGQKEQCTWVFTATRTIHQLLCALLVLPGNRLVSLPNQDSSDEFPSASFDVKSWLFQDTQSLYLHHAIKACDQISELVHSLKSHLNPANLHSSLPPALARPIRNTIISLARLDVVNSYARTPPLVWKLGWMPSPLGDTRTKLPPLPLHFLQERDVLREFICRVNLLGWTSRQQFEETWMCLLGVLNPVQLEEEHPTSADEDMERTQCAVLATRCITALLIASTLTPHSGDPSTSLPEHQPRDKPLAFLHTRVGKKLGHIRSLIEQEVRSLTDHRCDLHTHHSYSGVHGDTGPAALLTMNIDREQGRHEFLLGQLSIEYIWSVVGMLNPTKILPSDSSNSESDLGNSSPETSPVVPNQPTNGSQDQVDGLRLRSRSFEVSGLDLNSCLQFLLELYGSLLSPSANPAAPLMQLAETVKSVVALSDMFTDRSQFEWMFDTLLEVYRVHPSEDEVMNQYLAVGICKAAAILGMDAAILERVMKMVDTFLKSTHLPTKVAVLYGALYLLESGGASESAVQVVSVLVEALSKTLGSITQLHTTIHSQQHVLVTWALTLYLIENYMDAIKDVEFIPKVIQMAISTVSASEEVTPLLIYLAVIRGLERLVLTDVLSKQDTEALIKLSVDRLCLPSSQRSLAGLGLMLTCMYSGKQMDQWSPTVEKEAFEFTAASPVFHDPESLIVAMERVTVLFDRIRKGCPYEARVIARVLPSFLSDFFPPQDIMNKVIGEFLSSQQPHPQLMARVVFQVFEQLLERQQLSLVHDWVMLSLSNFTQRTPVAMAIWSLTCFFVCSSTNQWLRALLTHVLGRMGKMDTLDRRLFIVAALEFRSQLRDESQLRAFYSTFQSVASLDSTYSQLLACL